MTDRLRVGVVGAGFMGETHLAGWAAEGIPATVFDVDDPKASARAPASSEVQQQPQAQDHGRVVVTEPGPDHLDIWRQTQPRGELGLVEDLEALLPIADVDRPIHELTDWGSYSEPHDSAHRNWVTV